MFRCQSFQEEKREYKRIQTKNLLGHKAKEIQEGSGRVNFHKEVNYIHQQNIYRMSSSAQGRMKGRTDFWLEFHILRSLQTL